MENQVNDLGSSPSLSNSLLSNSLTDINTSSSSNDWSFWSILGVVILVILVLAIAGFNLFSYLAVGTQSAANWFQTTADQVKQYTGQIPLSQGLGNVVGVSALGTKEIIDATTKDINAVSTAIDQGAERLLDPIIQKTTGSALKGTPVSQTVIPTNNTENNSLNRALNTQQALNGGLGAKGPDYNADEATSAIQKTNGKAGWCYIGNDNGTRTCARVSENQMCMSGDIFPTSEVCINPSLRA
jgi:hypothetical protein